jgi:hypothetical protein
VTLLAAAARAEIGVGENGEIGDVDDTSPSILRRRASSLPPA